jgi:hypothetical protein
MLRTVLALVLVFGGTVHAAETYAERLGWPADARVLILHMDDAGMSHDSNAGIERVLEHGAAKSLSVMMPTPWVPEIVHYLNAHPGTDAGLHLTLNSEWHEYRWGPLAGVLAVPGLVDNEGALWSSVQAVTAHAKPEEVDREIRAQLERAERMGFHPTHLDSHMGTLFASPAFLEKYIQLGIEKHIPLMLPGGHDTYIAADLGEKSVEQIKELRDIGQKLWNAGLPVLDDLHNTSYSWKIPPETLHDDAKLQNWRARRYMETLAELKPGLTMVIMHCTEPSNNFVHITDSGPLRKADMLAMLDPEFAAFLQREHFLVTTWRETAERRARVH